MARFILPLLFAAVMNVNENLLDEFAEQDEPPYKKYFVFVAAVYILQNIVSVILYLMTMSSLGSNGLSYFGHPSVYVFLLLFKSLSITALFLFLFKKRWGWILALVLNSHECLQKGFLILNFLFRPNDNLSYLPADNKLMVIILFTFALSGVLVILLLSKKMQLFFNISRHTLLTSITVSVVLFLINILPSFR